MQDNVVNNAAAFHAQQIVNALAGGWLSQAITVAAQIGVADILAEGPRSAEAIADKTGCHAGALYRILRALASVNIFVERDGGLFELTPQAEFLRSDHPRSLRSYALMMGSEWIWRSWGRLEVSARTGKPAFEAVFGAPLFDYYARHPEAAQSSAEGLRSRSQQEDEALLRAYDFSTAGSIADIGGGRGGLLATILAAHPHMRGMLFDLPHTIARAPQDCGHRLDTSAGDFFREVPAGHDLYILKKVLHDWQDPDALRILQVCRAAIPRHGRLLVIDQVVADGNGPSYAKLLDLLMLVLSGGRERTAAEHQALLTKAGFRLVRITPVMMSLAIIEAVPA